MDQSHFHQLITTSMRQWDAPLLQSVRPQLSAIRVNDHTLHVTIQLQATSQAAAAAQDIEQRLTQLIHQHSPTYTLHCVCVAERAAVQPTAIARHIIAVAAGKGGVGKSTIAYYLARALQQNGLQVGLLDADIMGPSLPTILQQPHHRWPRSDGALPTLMADGLACQSIGFVITPEQATIWRGPMVSGAIKQLALHSQWPPLDVLIIDLPPGTGDVSLTVAQALPLTGAMLISTPHPLAMADVRRCAQMMQKLNVPLLGLVMNMAGRLTSQGEVEPMWGHTVSSDALTDLQLPQLIELPLMDDVANFSALTPQHTAQTQFQQLATTLMSVLGLQRQAA